MPERRRWRWALLAVELVLGAALLVAGWRWAATVADERTIGRIPLDLVLVGVVEGALGWLVLLVVMLTAHHRPEREREPGWDG